MAATGVTVCVPETTGHAAPWLAPWVAGAIRRLVPLDSRSTRHAYFRLAGTRRVVALEGPAGLGLPIAITLSRSVFARAIAARHLTLGRRRLEIDGCPLPLVWMGNAPPRFNPSAAAARRAWIALDVLMAAESRPSAPPAVWKAIAHFAAALEVDDDDAVAAAGAGLIGLGPGSTPAGDDIVAAAAATLIAISPKTYKGGRIEPILTGLRRTIAGCLGRTTPLSAALLEAAAEGYMIERLARCLERLIRGEPAGAAVRALCGIGHSSGYFLAVGAGAGLAVAAGTSRGPAVAIAG